jgi:uncharacterized membrane protein
LGARCWNRRRILNCKSAAHNVFQLNHPHTKAHFMTKPRAIPWVGSIRDISLGHALFAAAMAGLGILGLIYGDFALQWQPVPPDLPGRQALAYLSGAIMLVGGTGLLVKPIAGRCALGLSLYLLIFWVSPQALKVVPAALSVGAWLGFCETLAAAIGGWILWSTLRRPAVETGGRFGELEMARRLFGIACLVFGLSHFEYAAFTAGMIPPWLPLRVGLAYATGAGHAAAGLAILVGIRPRLAATLEAAMMSAFVVLVHIPSLWTVPDWAPTARIEWTALFWSSALAGSAWIVAHSFRGRPPRGGSSGAGSSGRPPT